MKRVLRVAVIFSMFLMLFTACKEDEVIDPTNDPTKPAIEWVSIPAGTFIMGSPESEVKRWSNEVQHEVTLSAFKMSKYEVTFEQYDLF